MCGSVVMPAPPEPPPAYDQSCGRIRSSYGPSIFLMNAAATLCWPALTRIGSVRSGVWPRPSAPAMLINWYCTSATRSPSTEMSMSSKRVFSPELNVISNWYSPSAGNTWLMTMPPRVPNGAPSTRSHGCCDMYVGLV